MLQWGPHYNPLMNTLSDMHLQSLTMVPGQTYKPKESGKTSPTCIFDVKVFNPHAPSNKRLLIPACYAHHERIKQRLYEQRINEVELASFTPLIFSTTGAMGKSTKVFYGCLADKIATKTKQPYSSTITWVQCRLNFSLIRSSVSCLRGSRHNSCPSCRLPDSTTLAIWEASVVELGIQSYVTVLLIISHL